MRKASWLVPAALAAAVASSSGTCTPTLAKACGGVFAAHLRKDERKPSLAYEGVLVIHDQSAGREHLIRELVFRTAKQPFGFVVPTPSRPEVDKVRQNPFPRLRALFPYQPPLPGSGSLGFGSGAGSPQQRGGVHVLEVKKVGSFTAFVLSADDEASLSKWLAKHQLERGDEAAAWLSHYVRAKYFFVAMRYDPHPSDDAVVGRTRSETVRFSFDTPLAYYPYFEPEPTLGQEGEPRMLELWLVTREPAIPVALRASGGTLSWVRPFAEGFRYQAPRRADVEEALGSDAKLLFADAPRIQRFVDQKRSRQGFGDVVFVPSAKTDFGERSRAALERLAVALDPSLLQAKEQQ